MISVALAAYKGEKYIAEQINSILPQLGPEDEIIVSDDKPGEATERVVRRLMKEDSRIIYIPGKGKGVVSNFISAIKHCKGDKIFLCDQDDVWLPDKVQKVMEAFKDGADLVLHNCYETDKDLNITVLSFFDKRGSRKGKLYNIYKNSYMGCCMAFDRKMLKYIFPIPKYVPMHDQWIGLICECYGKVTFIDIPLIYHRVHGKNVTGISETSAKQKLQWRRYILRKLYKRVVLKK
ncbi:MAG: glycosyltransferase family 2 protein [Acutalibacteraceae bacterium]